MFKKILIATDFSRHANYAFQRAIQFARSQQAELTCLHVINLDWANNFNIFNNEDEQLEIQKKTHKAERAFEKILKRITPPYPVKFLVNTGRTQDQIIEYINSNNIDLVFMGAHGVYYLHDFILGTNSQSVVRKSNIPIQLVRKTAKKMYQRILIATDFSDTSQKATEMAYKAYPDATFLLLHIADIWYGKKTRGIGRNQQRHDVMNQVLQEKLSQFLKKCDVKHDCFSTKFVGGYPADDIVRHALLWEAQLVVLGAKGHTLLYDIFLGHVTGRLLHINPVDMLIVPECN